MRPVVRAFVWMAKAAPALLLVGCLRASDPNNDPAGVCRASGLPLSPVALRPAFPNLAFSEPLALLQAPGDNTRWFVVERGGRVLVFPNSSAVTRAQATTFIDIQGRVDAAPGEAGLLGMAFHPDFPVDPRVFLSYTRTGAPLVSVIARFVTNDGGLTLDPASEQEILTLDQPFTNHNGGQVGFGPDGFLYIGFGDGGSGGDPDDHGQNTNTLFGTLLRIDVDSGAPYAIPPGNPFVGGGGRGEIYAWGFRNPWRWSFDRGNGELWLGDVGQGAWEEIDKVVLGGDYGWRCREGAHDFNTAGCGGLALIDPVAEYDHSAGRCSVTGGYVYRGSAIAALFGSYVFGDFCSGEIWSVDNSGGSMRLIASSGTLISSFGEAHDGELYAVAFGDEGCVLRLTPR